MIVKKVVDLCIKSGTVVLFNSPEGQWLSDASAIYPLWDMPELDKVTFCSVFDITKKKQEKLAFRHLNGLPPAFDFRDAVDNEKECEPIWITVSEGKRVFRPYITANGVAYFDERYFAPFSDSAEMTKLFERVTPSGNSYFVLKRGLLLQGIILSADAINSTLVEKLKMLYTLSKVALENKQLKGRDEEC